MTPPSPIIELNALSLSRGENTLIAGLSLSVMAGDAVWVTGPNGVGKTTLLLACAGLISPDHGEVRWTGGSAQSTVAFAPFNGPERDGMTLGEELSFWQDLSGDPLDLSARLATVGLATLAATPVAGLSAGQRKRLSLARLLGSGKSAWLMDEPFAGLDGQGQALVSQCLDAHLSNGGCALIASHQPVAIPGHSARRLILEPAA